MSGGDRKRILVVGGGISGITAAHVISRAHHVTLIERNGYLGGHTNTRTVEDPLNPELPVDTGFIVCNPRNYPSFYRMLETLGISLQPSDMTFGMRCDNSGLEYMGPSLKELVMAPANLLKPEFVGMILEQRRFNKKTLSDLRGGALGDCSLGDYLQENRVSEFFVDNYLAPLIASIWSTPDSGALGFPALTFATFFDNHGMLELSKRPAWQTVKGGSHSYVKAFRAAFPGELRLSCPALSIRREAGGVALVAEGSPPERFDEVVIATHADEALALLADPSPEESTALGAWSYSKNRAVLHTDSSLLPRQKRLWAAWNYRRRKGSASESPVAITYYMNKLQRLRAARDYFVTLNSTEHIDERRILYQVEYTHPVYVPRSIQSQRELKALSGSRNTHFCGAYLGYGFHEDGVRSALDVAARFGLAL